jgi:hypothetical protein
MLFCAFWLICGALKFPVNMLRADQKHIDIIIFMSPGKFNL